MKKVFHLAAMSALVAPLVAFADAAQAPTAAPAVATPAEPPKATPWYNAVTLSGMVDAYYQVRLDDGQDVALSNRAFDTKNGFSLGYGKLSAALAPSPVGFRLDLGFGPTADIVTGTGNGHYIQQAYAAFKLGSAELDFGRFATSAGAEVVEAKDNWLYSRSLVFYLEPATHTGAKLNIPLSEQFNLTLGANNGWDVVTTDQAGRTGQLSLAYSGPSATTASANLYIGANPTLWSGAANTSNELRTFVDVVAGTTLGAVSLLGNFDWATESQPSGADAQSWWGLALAARYALPHDVARVTARGEVIKDSQGARFGAGTDTTVYEGTLGLSYPVGSNAEFRGEVRYDHADQPIFTSLTSKDQTTATIAALAWF